MPRIRSIKPEFFLHEELFDLEHETGLPIRVAFAGLWCQADREGRFKWRPRSLKSQILPFDDVDFSRVLHALATRGLVRCYAWRESLFGVVDGFHRHQVVNNREKESELPSEDDDESVSLDVERSTGRVGHASPTRGQSGKAEGERKGKGKEGKGKGTRRVDDASDLLFNQFWEVFPKGRKRSRLDALPAWKKAISKASPETIIAAATEYAASDEAQGKFVAGPAPWLNQGRWDDDRAAWEDKPDNNGKTRWEDLEV